MPVRAPTEDTPTASPDAGMHLLGGFLRGLLRSRPRQPRHPGIQIYVEPRTMRLAVTVLAALIGQLLSREQLAHNAHNPTIVAAKSRTATPV
ncbi:hypothetical protein [Nocardia sp. NBC_01009]|uniref:hypothetical protein n=1 Tax=Nocardia sp. NBC_01009 TaxID=2975996 RepID=UPI003863C5B5|nr:hypothetical protein OHA42_38155 [Nocardia sp. NBC_01009]